MLDNGGVAEAGRRPGICTQGHGENQTTPLQAIRSDGSVDRRYDPGLSDGQLVQLYRQMVFLRFLDERLMLLQRQGRIGFHIGSSGEEAAVLGSGVMMAETDCIFPSYREFGLALMRGMPLKAFLDHMLGNAADPACGRQMASHYTFRAGRMVSISSPVGTQIIQ